ncbi:helix-turn-helix domain-containing protein [Staphylococcus haemolyticus]|uniref:helix-turn-helix domain-containing protein n=1 Tax=Staphylococcus haemolyticus TaxID=1283 RepID=UPI0015D91FCE|nr:helix-turn-helix domain-containing protein [Staphylococcus haemolyticus]MCE0455488.1 helix-turn-helix transcriptional regulator [Staphylococcus haemolyticus]
MDNRIAELRKEKGMTLKQLAEKFNIRDNTLSQYETGKRSPQLGLLQEMANYFDVSIEYITKYSDKRDYPINTDEEAIELLQKLKNEKKFTRLNLSYITSLNIASWCIEHTELLENKYPELLNTAYYLVKDVVSKNKILRHYSEERRKRNNLVDKIDELLLEEEYYGATVYQVYEFMKETERIGWEQTKEVMDYIKSLPTEEIEDEDF